jgi:hypothetical protein
MAPTNPAARSVPVAVSQNGWPANTPSLVASQQIPGSLVKVSVRTDAAGQLLLEVASAFDRLVEDIDNARGALDDWGYAERPIRGGSATSNHASGTAIDLDATKHPLGTDPHQNFTQAQIDQIHRILAVAGGVVRWGGDYVGRKDPMHFEINDGQTIATCARALAAMRQFNAGQQPAPPPAPSGQSASAILAAHGIQRAPEVVELAAATGLDLAAACAMLEKESGGGANIWGHDGVVVAPNTYVKGGQVTEANYRAYKAAVLAGKAGRQGCGPTQLTYGGFQDMADAVGGCWDWRANVLTGFKILAGQIKSGGTRVGFRTYNGGPTANAQSEAYATDAMNRYNAWRARLANSTPEGDDMAQVPQEQWDALNRDLRADLHVKQEQLDKQGAQLDQLTADMAEVKQALKISGMAAGAGGPSSDLDALADKLAERIRQA